MGFKVGGLVSLLALGFSAVSLWETTLKHPNLKLYVADTLSYTRDPWGGYEVFAVPVTISNRGARDGAVVALQLEIKNTSNGQTDIFNGAYTADAQYFGGNDDVTKGSRRPKLPFAPLSIAGRAAFTGTILFYPPEYRQQKLIDPKSHVVLRLKAQALQPEDWLDKTLGRRPEDLLIEADVPNFLPGGLLAGDMARLHVTSKTAVP